LYRCRGCAVASIASWRGTRGHKHKQKHKNGQETLEYMSSHAKKLLVI
jgi:hypothetical protein